MKMYNRRKVSRRVRKRRQTRYSKRRISRGIKRLPSWFPFGKSRTCKLRYSETLTINPALGTAGTYTFSANGLYDPNISGSGHQPYGFDQLCALYNHYYVTGARCRVTLINNPADTFFTIGLKLCDATTLNTSNPEYLLEQPGFRKRILSNSTALARNIVSSNFSCKKFFNLRGKSFILADDTLSGSASANPAEQAYFVFVYQPVLPTQDLTTATFIVEIDYIATFTGPKELSAS